MLSSSSPRFRPEHRRNRFFFEVAAVQVIDRNKALAIPPLFRLGFRPFFLGGAVLALLAIPVWLLAWHGWLSGWNPAGGWLAWHRHEMLFGFGLAIVAGFLLTAVQNWTGQPSLSGKPVALVCWSRWTWPSRC